ncbi:MAG: SH3 domain-containing C40 family peptidase [Lawsonibacter sp.]|nr:SH3 domain-containing C40 family peptidase [Lawsonibacter sp.]
MQLNKTTAARFTASLLLVSTLVVPALALTGTVNSGGSPLRVRTEASTNSEILTKLDPGTQVEVLSTVENGWYQIGFEEVTGYVSCDYLVVDGTENAISAVSAVAPTSVVSAADAIQPAAEPKFGKVTVSSLNIRSGAGADYDKAGTLSAGKVVEILSESSGWYRIESGYICADYVTIVDATEAAATSKGQEIAAFAQTFVGYPYVYGGSSPKGFDCSGFARYVYSQFGYSINRTASNQMDNGTSVSMSELQPGDLVFFKKAGSGSKRASHVGIYIGGNRFVHASTAQVGVITSSLSDAYYTSGFVGGRRLAQ